MSMNSNPTNEFRGDPISLTNSPQESSNATASYKQSSVEASPKQPINKINHPVKNPVMEKEERLITTSEEQSSLAKTLTFVLLDELTKKTRNIITSYLAAKQKGLKVAFLDINRKVNNSQVRALLRSINGKGKFTQPCLVVPLQQILNMFPDIKVFGLEGNQITAETPDLDNYVVVYDGQHRIVACEYMPRDVDVELELMEFDGENPLATIKLMNSYSRNWNNEDLRTSNLSAGITTNKLYEEAEVLQRIFGISRKFAEYILTFTRDATKKKDLVAGKDTTLYNAENGQRGKEIFSATFTNFEGKKEIKKIQFIDAIVGVYNGVSDTDKPNFRKSMKLYLGSMEEGDRKEVLSFINDKNYGQLNQFIETGYANFIKTHNDEVQLFEMEQKLDSRIKSFIGNLEKKNREKFEKTELKSGRVHEILKQHRNVEDKQKELAEQKAKEKRDRAKTNAKKAQDKANQAESEYLKQHNCNTNHDILGD